MVSPVTFCRPLRLNTRDSSNKRGLHHQNSVYPTAPISCLLVYMCIGARESIFDHFLSRSSAPTILDNRVPIGSPVLLMRTQALSSNRIKLPSFRSISFLALTTTACRISPRRTLFAIPKLDPPWFSGPKLFCFWTTTMIRSPIRAACLFFLMTATHSTTAAPELSMQFSIVFSCIIVAA